jgi:hypothetical protein
LAELLKYAPLLNSIFDRAYFIDANQWKEEDLPDMSVSLWIANAMHKLLRPSLQPQDKAEVPIWVWPLILQTKI